MEKYINKRLAEYLAFIRGKSCAVLGVGVSNIPLIKFLCDNGAHVTARDKKPKEELIFNKSLNIEELEARGVRFINGDGYLDGLCEDIIFKTPGLRFDNEKILEAQRRGCLITSEMETFLSLCPSKIIAVTGSDGKTTTTTLVAKILESAGKRVFLGGNIGNPLLSEIYNITPSDFTVLELSSFQLHTINRFENHGLPFAHISFPDVAIVTNITPNHLDWHTSFEEYAEAKKAIFSFMREGGKLVTNAGDPITKSFADEAQDRMKVCLFSSKINTDGYYADDRNIYRDGSLVLERRDIRLPGDHNAENYMAAMAATEDFVTTEDVLRVARSFGGVEHRLEYVSTIDGADYYNSSIDSSPTRSIAAITCFPPEMKKKLIVIMGGYDKNIPYDPIGVPVCENVRGVFLCGKTAPKIRKAIESAENFGDDTEIFDCESFEEAIASARKYAKNGDKVILTPASASFDMFRNFMERGQRFKQIVHSMENKKS